MTTHAGLARGLSPQPRSRTRRPARRSLDVLSLVSAHNSLSQRAYIELSGLGHDVSVAVVGSGADMEAAVARHRPDLIVCPMLKKRIPESIWSATRCLIVHPGPMGDRGPSSLDWAIETGASEWGVIVLEANDDFDAGRVWATRTFAMRPTGKSSVYRHEVRRAAIEALSEAVERVAAGSSAPAGVTSPVTGHGRPLMKQEVRAIDWSSDPTDTVVRKIRAAEGHPGALDTVEGLQFHLFGVQPERGLRGPAGEIIARRDGAICRATVGGAVWITHLKRRSEPGQPTLKLPATRALSLAGRHPDVPEVPAPLHAPIPSDHTHRELAYEEHRGVGYLRFDFYNGAMSTEQCERLLEAYQYARSRTQTKVIALMGGSDYFSNGIHLNVVEAADNPGLESWSNLNAMNDLVREIVVTDSHLVLSALRGDTAAGGVPLALAADHVVAREDVVLNPFYGHMGGLYGSGYWTYLLPRRVGERTTARLTSGPFNPIGTEEAVSIGLLDAAFGVTAAGFEGEVRRLAGWLASPAGFSRRLEEKRRRRARDELRRPLEAYRADEMARSHECFFGADRSYHEARRRFAYKLA
jgi:putative two-component system hydrogenase maturation factor HypX/HoxX